jgi:hypothetical protein
MGVHAARRDDAAGGVDLASTAGQALAELDDPAAGNADVGSESVGRRRNAGVAHDQIEWAHQRAPVAPITDIRLARSVDNLLEFMASGWLLVHANRWLRCTGIHSQALCQQASCFSAALST